MSIEFEHDYLSNQTTAARIKVMGIGGAGGNSINHMLDAPYENVEFIVINTDAQALKTSKSPLKLQIGLGVTSGRGAGANPELGKAAAEEDIDKIGTFVQGADIVFLIAGLGGGTGSGALPIIARAVREQGALCIAVVTKPFEFEGKRRLAVANQALEALKKEIDTLIVIPNQRLLDITDHKMSLVDAFGLINSVIHQFVKGIADIIFRAGHINVDFADVCTIMRHMGMAVMGTGRASGVDRSQRAAMQALSSPLLENASIEGARAVLLNITGSSKLGLYEVQGAASLVYEAAPDANIIIGSCIDESMGDEVVVTIIATGIEPVTAQPVSLRPAHTLEMTPEVKGLENPHDKARNKIGYETPGFNTHDLEIPAFLRRAKEKDLVQK
jgi:cell division protein FtsZ